MPGFTNLSNELYFEILRYLPPPDLGSFFCINKHLYALTAIQRIRYSSLKRRFSTSLNTKQPGSTARLLESIFVNPQIALYVQHFTIDGCSDFGEIDYTGSDMAPLETALRDLADLSVDEVQECISDLSDAPEDHLIGLALMFFPNLTSIDIRYSRDFESQTFYRLSRLLINTIRQYTDTKSNGVLFPKLTSVTISTPGDGDTELIQVFATLPSVKIVNAEKLVSNTEALEAIVLEKGSNVSDLNISNADLSPRGLTIHLQRFEKLQSFTYWPTSDPEPQYEFDAFMIITALLASTQNSLRELHIRSGSADPEYMGSLRKFRVLENLETDTDLLFGPERYQNFSTSLPSSIKEVKLHGWPCTYGNFQALLVHLTRAKNDFPSLTSIEFFETSLPEHHAARLQDLCARSNICLKLVDCEPDSLPIYTRHRGHYAERQAKKTLTQRKNL